MGYAQKIAFEAFRVPSIVLLMGKKSLGQKPRLLLSRLLDRDSQLCDTVAVSTQLRCMRLADTHRRRVPPDIGTLGR